MEFHALGSHLFVVVHEVGFLWSVMQRKVSPSVKESQGSRFSLNKLKGLEWYHSLWSRHEVRIEGPVQKVSELESEQYFHSRPRGSQIGAIVSKQSTIVPGRHVLHQEYKELENKFSDGSMIPKPKYWGGYRLKPELFEFWQGQQSRLHDRLFNPISL
ncbi:Pyridoxine/pyridoxamine 5'-phosphate oxidase 1, chloroplastic [Vitis vinifera]|uniref:pyridoxal 5'-phosphate synthase n=1 Tax=Vitis vinifera TaxID=29760 RepID=A0A438F7X6_VITVI|nr:Pyridoxine/pyridoxamine 5'-phosphate oxidase 1, chloroplastic [Vitis vinifera]